MNDENVASGLTESVFSFFNTSFAIDLGKEETLCLRIEWRMFGSTEISEISRNRSKLY